MAMDESDGETNLENLNENLARVEELSQRLIAALSSKNPANASLSGPSQELFAKAAAAYWSEALENPAKLYEHQLEYWSRSVRHFVEAQQQFLKLYAPCTDTAEAPDPEPGDKRFANPLWETHPYFKFIKHQYQLNAEAIRKAVAEVDDLAPKEKRRLEYFSQQIIDMMSPTNFLGTNPDALEKAVETEGESLVRGSRTWWPTSRPTRAR